MTHPIAVELLARERHEELVRLAQATHAARRARPAEGELRSWRRRLGRALVTLGVKVGLPSERRSPALRDAVALLEGCAR